MKNELWDIYDKNRIKTGQYVKRGEKLYQGQFHLIAHVCIFNDKGEMLIHQRSKNKPKWKSLWDFSSGGAAIVGEDSATAAERECREELGIELDLSNERPAITIHFNDNDGCGFDDYYLIEKNIEINKLILSDEIESIKWADEAEILSMIKEKVFIDFYDCFIQLLFSLRKNKNTHKT